MPDYKTPKSTTVCIMIQVRIVAYLPVPVSKSFRLLLSLLLCAVTFTKASLTAVTPDENVDEIMYTLIF